ncbi:MAG: tetratricopeptide repeat protein [Leptolyngbyaceae cyanobacterium bins.59]|nr:tetratricopeptide repeat protein [Leptolyngbyaceae cyanobacterium bins.59]
MPDQSMPDQIVLGGRYELALHLGGGGFGQTFLARDLHLPGKPFCVVKQLKPKTTNPVALQTARSLFNKEAEVLYALGSHDRIPRLFAHFEENREFYLVQEFVEGKTLSKELKNSQPASEEKVIEFLEDVLTTLKFVHEQQVIHRDIKPSNLMRRKADGKIVLIDFGAVKQIGAPTAEDYDPTTLTIAIGSPGYTPNEQIAGRPRFSSDIYALGVLAICMLLGIRAQQIKEDPRTSEILWRDEVQVSPQLATVLDKMVRYDYRQRYQSAVEALESLRYLVEPITLAISTGLASAVFSASQSDLHLDWLERGDELFQIERYSEALSAYDKVIKMRPDEYVAWFKRGIVLETLQLYEEALMAYDRVIELRPQDYLAWFKRAKMLEQLQQYEEARAAYEQVADVQPNNYWAWCDRGRMLEQMGHYEAAVTSYDRSIQIKPDFQPAMEGRKRALSQLNQIDDLYHLEHYEMVLEGCDRLLKTNPENCHAWFMRGMALEKLERLEEALDAYYQVIQVQPEDHLAWLNRAKVLEKLERYGEAATTYAEVVRLQAGHYWSWYDWGRVLERLQQFEEAILAYDKAVMLKPGFRPALENRNRVLACLSRGRTTQNRSAITTNKSLSSPKVLSLSVAEEAVDWLKRGIFLEQSHRYPEALGAYDRALETHQTNPDFWQRRGNVLYNLDRLDEATVAYQEAARLNPREPMLWHHLGGALARLHRYQEALESFDRAIELKPDSPELWYWRGRVLYELKDYRAVLAAYDRALAIKPAYEAALTARNRLLGKLKLVSR